MLTKCLSRENLELFLGSRQNVFAGLCDVVNAALW